MSTLMSTMVQFRIGDKVVYPNHGVGTVEQVSQQCIAGCSLQFYQLRFEDPTQTQPTLRVMVPLQNAAHVGMRAVATHRDASRVLEFLRDGVCEPAGDWKDRFRFNSERLQAGSLLQVAEVYKGLRVLNASKPLSTRERKMFDHATGLLTSELAMALGVSLDEAAQQLEAAARATAAA